MKSQNVGNYFVFTYSVAVAVVFENFNTIYSYCLVHLSVDWNCYDDLEVPVVFNSSTGKYPAERICK